jgi:hypothetical protein
MNIIYRLSRTVTCILVIFHNVHYLRYTVSVCSNAFYITKYKIIQLSIYKHITVIKFITQTIHVRSYLHFNTDSVENKFLDWSILKLRGISQ